MVYWTEQAAEGAGGFIPLPGILQSQTTAGQVSAEHWMMPLKGHRTHQQSSVTD